MSSRHLWLLAVLLTASGAFYAHGQDLTDEATDLEEISAEGDAVSGILKTTKKKLAKKTSENNKKFADVRKKRDRAAARRDKATSDLKKAEEDLAKLEGEGDAIREEMKDLDGQIAVVQKDLLEQQNKIAEVKAANASLIATREKKKSRFKELQKQQNQLIRESAMAQDKAALFERESKEIIEAEDAAVRDLEKAKGEYVAEKVMLDQKVAGIHAEIKKLRDRKATVQREISNARAASYRLKEEVKSEENRRRRLQEEAENQVMYDESSR